MPSDMRRKVNLHSQNGIKGSMSKEMEALRLRLPTRSGSTGVALAHSGGQRREGPRSKGTVGSGQGTDDGLAEHGDEDEDR